MNRSVLRWLPSVFLVCACAPACAIDPLPAYGADAAEITVSGVSSGGFMAVQFHVAHSGTVKGVGGRGRAVLLRTRERLDGLLQLLDAVGVEAAPERDAP